jgi:hypothetical protein
MTVAAAGSPLASGTGRAVSIRRGGAAAGTAGAADRRAAILVVGPGCWTSPEHAIAAVSGGGFRVVVAAELDGIILNNLINAGILPVCLAPEAIAELQDAVESDPGILLTVDVGRADVRARGKLLARFGSDRSGREAGSEAMARRLLMAQRMLRSADLAGDARARLQRRLAALCDAVKAPGADAARSAWRLDLLLAELASASPQRPVRDGPVHPSRPVNSFSRSIRRSSGVDTP